jgi:hypothetical protein
VRDVRSDKAVSNFSRNEIFFEAGLDRPNHVERLCEFAFFAQPIKMASAEDQPPNALSFCFRQHDGHDGLGYTGHDLELPEVPVGQGATREGRRPHFAADRQLMSGADTEPPRALADCSQRKGYLVIIGLPGVADGGSSADGEMAKLPHLSPCKSFSPFFDSAKSSCHPFNPPVLSHLSQFC